MALDVYMQDFVETKRMFVSQVEHGWNNHLDADHRLYEAFIHGYTFGVRDAVKARDDPFHESSDDRP